MKLHVKILGSGRPMVILHGLFGSGDNWVTMANTFAGMGFEIHLIDMRNHGRSHHDPLFNYQVMADDLQEHIDSYSLHDPVLLGHSMGGKTIIQYASTFPSTASAAIVVDIAPRYFPVRHQEVIDALVSVDFTTHTTRKSVEAQLKRHIDDEGTVQLLMKGLYWVSDERLAWRFDVASIGASIHEVGAEVDTAGLATTPFLFIRGAESDYVTEQDIRDLSSRFPEVRFVTVQGAGHRVHADRPEEFIRVVAGFLQDIK